MPASGETRRVAGLAAPVEIVSDRHGIPHISAAGIEDAFFGQGYAAAALRLWQIDLAHRRGLGRLAAAFGPDFVPFDQAARRLLFRGDMAAEWRALDPRLPGIVRAWIAGVNARVREVRADPSLLPPEFAVLDVLPEEWAPEDLLRARYAPAPNVQAELRRAQLACRGALAADLLVQPLEPAWHLSLPAGLDPCGLHATDLQLLDRLRAPLPFAKAVRQGAADEDPDAQDGSNAWVVAPWRSASGRAILANDPHLGFGVPGPRLITHLRAPGLDAIGGGPAGQPGFLAGHNDRIAFGRTDFRIDQEDLYVLRLNADASAYRTKDGWQAITRSEEKIAVRGGPDASVTLSTTPLGPIIAEDAGRAVALRSALLQPGPPAGLVAPLLLLARSWPEYRAAAAQAGWGSNYFYADVDGNIGWQAGGRVPRRRHHDGLLPVPAEGDYPWDGFLSIDEMPGEFNPERGWIGNGNQMPLPPDWPVAERKISFEWVADDRYRRIAEVLGAGKQHAIEDSVALQNDTAGLRARALLPLLDRISDPDLAAPVALLRGWDGRVEAGSGAAALWEFWSAELQTETRHHLVAEQLRPLLGGLHPHVVRDLLLAPDARLGADPVATRDAILATALRRAVTLRGARDWGSIHTVHLRHPLAARIPEADISGLGSGGDGSTVMARWWAGPSDTNTSGGAMFRVVVELGNWDSARAINAPGQSGDPRSPHYRDLYRPWLEGAMFALPYTAAGIEAVAEHTLRLEPMP
jgi:penicillin amidase